MKKLQILAIDDMAPSRLMYQRIFEAGGHRATIAQDPDRLLDFLREETYDVLVLDLHMPRQNGFDLLVTAREQHPAGRPFPDVILVTADNSPEAAEQARSHGIQHFVLKRQLHEELPRVLSDLASASR